MGFPLMIKYYSPTLIWNSMYAMQTLININARYTRGWFFKLEYPGNASKLESC